MHVLFAGTAGYLGRFPCADYAHRGRHFTALARDDACATGLGDIRVEADAKRSETPVGITDGVELVVSSVASRDRRTRSATGRSTTRRT